MVVEVEVEEETAGGASRLTRRTRARGAGEWSEERPCDQRRSTRRCRVCERQAPGERSERAQPAAMPAGTGIRTASMDYMEIMERKSFNTIQGVLALARSLRKPLGACHALPSGGGFFRGPKYKNTSKHSSQSR